MEFKCNLSSKWPFGRFMHSLCKYENIPMSGESRLLHNKRKWFPPYPDQSKQCFFDGIVFYSFRNVIHPEPSKTAITDKLMFLHYGEGFYIY